MSLINIIAVVFIVLIIIMTFISEPKLSMQYYKAAGHSIGVVLDKAKDVVVGWIKNWNEGAKGNGRSR